jgi:hypothetical protein
MGRSGRAKLMNCEFMNEEHCTQHSESRKVVENEMRHRAELGASSRGKFAKLAVCGISLGWLAAALFAVWPALISGTKAESMSAETSRVFELRVYRVLPGKMPTVEAQFRDAWAQLLDRHNLKVVGYWAAEDNTFVYIVAHQSRDDAKKNWDALRADPEYMAIKKSESGDKATDKIDSTYMEPTAFSPLR